VEFFKKKDLAKRPLRTVTGNEKRVADLRRNRIRNSSRIKKTSPRTENEDETHWDPKGDKKKKKKKKKKATNTNAGEASKSSEKKERRDETQKESETLKEPSRFIRPTNTPPNLLKANARRIMKMHGHSCDHPQSNKKKSP